MVLIMGKIATPRWFSFKQHCDQFFNPEQPDYAKVVGDLALFACLPDAERRNRLEKVTFDSITHIPDCIKYEKPTNLKFIKSDEEFCDRKLINITVGIKELIKLEEDHFLSLHPVRYDRVKEAITLGEIDMPIVYLCDEGFPRVQDGRHRVIALYKYGVTQVKILIPEDELKVISSFFDHIKEPKT